MRIDQVLKQQNIAEYLLYMWQTEDLLRANGCNLDRIEETLIRPFAPAEQPGLKEWYGNLVTMMYEEDVREKGHLQINRNVLQNLSELHHHLLASPKYPFYTSAYFKALPFIVELRSKNGKKDDPELETCFEALYGVMLLRLQKSPVSPGTARAIEAISLFLSMLANYYNKDLTGELKFE
ncbi:MAG: DUF4924 family protein [Bacteroides sp.]